MLRLLFGVRFCHVYNYEAKVDCRKQQNESAFYNLTGQHEQDHSRHLQGVRASPAVHQLPQARLQGREQGLQLLGQAARQNLRPGGDFMNQFRPKSFRTFFFQFRHQFI
jgi:hypothetical protein